MDNSERQKIEAAGYRVTSIAEFWDSRQRMSHILP